MNASVARTAGWGPLAGLLLLSLQVASAGGTGLIDELRRQAAEATLVVAHRGDSASHPENTLPAFRSALEQDSDLVELDFHQTRDGVLVCMHDETLDRTTDAVELFQRNKVRADELTLRELGRLDAGLWKADRFRKTAIPSLEAAIKAIDGQSVALIERKGGEARVTVELLRRMKATRKVVVQSFDWDYLEAVHRLEPAITIGALGSRRLEKDQLVRLERTGAKIVHWSYRDLTLEDLATFRERELLVLVYTVDHDLGLLGAATSVDGITTNRPGRMRELIRTGRLN